MPRRKPDKESVLANTNARFANVCRVLVAEGMANSQNEIAKRLDMSRSNLHPVVAGTRNVTTEIIIKLCAHYFVNPAYLFPPWEKKMFLTGGREKLLRLKRIEIEQAKKELRYLENINR